MLVLSPSLKEFTVYWGSGNGSGNGSRSGASLVALMMVW